MKKKSGLKLSQTLFFCTIAIILLLALYISSITINNELEHYIKQTQNEISMQNVNTIQCKIEDDILILEEISDRVRFDDSFQSIMDGMRSASEAYGFKRMGVIGRDGIAHSSDGVELDIANEDHIVRAFKGENVISDIIPDFADGKTIFVFAIPIYSRSGDSVTGVLFATCDTDAFRSHLTVSAFGGSEYSYIVKSDGTTVIDSDHKDSYKNMENAFVAMEDVGDNKEVAQQMRKDMSKGLDGCLEYRNNGVKKYITYDMLEINDWYILSVVSADVMDGSKFRIMMVTYIIFALIGIITLLFVAFIVKTKKIKQVELEQILYVDELTGGLSYTKFCIDAKGYLVNRLDKTEKIACIMVDMENFELINNLYGKAEGDRAILNFYNILCSVIGKNGIITRKTEDKFYALIFFREDAELQKLFKRFTNELKSSDNASDKEYVIKPTIGVYVANIPKDDIETVTNNAAIAHDTAKNSGKKVAFYDEAQRDRLRADKRLEDKMELAQKNHEFIPYFQPKYDADTGKLCGAEALVRWKNPDGSITPPGKFIPLAESNGFIRVLDRDIFNAVCKFQHDIMENEGICVPISVNVSRQLMYEQNFAVDYIETIRKYNISPELIELEITESVLFDDYGVFNNIINTLRENGFKILMDDFGTGYSSLMMLGSVPIDNLKLDKSFVDSYEEEKGRKIIISVIELAKSLSLPLTAEGVETKEQYDFLKKLGCNIIQGFYFSKPVPGEDFRQMLVKSSIS